MVVVLFVVHMSVMIGTAIIYGINNGEDSDEWRNETE